MSINIPANNKVDWRKNVVLDEAKNRALSVNLQKKYQPISNALWAEKQNENYLNTLQVRNVPSLNQLLANDLESKNQSDPILIMQLGMSNLLTITDEKNANYILDRLSDEEVNMMNQNFPSLLKTLKTKYSKMNKDVFLEMVKNKKPVPDPDTDSMPSLIGYENYEQRSDVSDSSLKERKARDQAQNLNDETGPPNILERFRYEENPMDRDISPKKMNTIYGQILNEKLQKKSSTEEEVLLYKRTQERVESLKTKKELSDYIDREITTSRIPSKYNKEDLKEIAFKIMYKLEMGYMDGNGLRRKRRIIGGGSPLPTSRNMDKKEIGKFTVDLCKLRQNILSVKYSSCRGSVAGLKVERISEDVKNVIMDIVEDKFNSNPFKKMLTDEQRIVSNFVRTLKIQNVDMDDFDRAYQHEYELLLGEVNSGNNNDKIKKQLKQYILRGINEKLIPRAQGLNQILELSS